MNRRKHLFIGFLLFYIFCCVLFPPKIESFPYQSGWPKDFSGEISRSPVIADVDNDGFKEIILTVHDDVRVYIFKANGDIYNGSWPKSIARNSGTAPTVEDLDNDGDLEIVIGCGNLYAWHHTGDVVNGFPIIISDGYITTSPAIGDMTGDNVPEIASGVSGCRFYVWDNHGNVLSGFPKTFSGLPACGVAYTPAIGDIDLDGINEVIVQVYNEHVYAFNADGNLAAGIWDVTHEYGATYSDITVGDIDSDNILEVLLIAHPQQGGYYPVVLNHDTSSVPGWPSLNLNNFTPAGLIMGDIDDDGKLEVISGNQYSGTLPQVYVWEGDTGLIKSGWPKTLTADDSFMRNMILGDVNGDGKTDILGAAFGWIKGKIFAWDVDGNLISGFPININGFGPTSSTCFISDLDNDKDVEIGVGVWDTYSSSKVFIWDLPYPYKGKRMPWPQDRHDPGHTNNYHWYNPLPQVPTVTFFSFLSIFVVLSFLILTKTKKSGILSMKRNRGGKNV